MPSFTEIGWILEGVKLLRRFAPLMERLIAGDRQVIKPAIEPFSAEVRQIVSDSLIQLEARIEPQINDLRKQVQETHLKLNQLQEQVARVQQDCEQVSELARGLRGQMVSLGRWILITAMFAILSSALAIALLVRR